MQEVSERYTLVGERISFAFEFSRFPDVMDVMNVQEFKDAVRKEMAIKNMQEFMQVYPSRSVR